MVFDREAFAIRMQKLRAESKLGRTAYAERIGITYGTLRGYETGGTAPTIEVASTIVKNLNINLLWFVHGIGARERK